jgi:hypothetical protein
MTLCPRDVDFRNGSRWEGERENTHAKQHQGKDWATKAQQDLPVNVVINSRLLVRKVNGELYLYAKPALRVDPYFQVFNI